MTKPMVEVLALHRLDAVTYLVSQEEYLCICGKRSDNHEEHQSRALSAAGFGLVADAKAEALEEAATELARLPYVRPDAPGRAEYERVLAVRRGNADAWLKERAKTVRGEG